MVTPEWLWTLSVAVPATLVLGWGLWSLGWLERRAIWPRVQGEVKCREGQVRPVWCGWQLDCASVQVRWVGGPLGERTWVRKPGQRWVKTPGIVVGPDLP